MDLHWQIYRKLELIPSTVHAPSTSTSGFAAWLKQRLQSLVKPLANSLAPQQQVEHLERCWLKSELEIHETRNNDTLTIVWRVLKQSVLDRIHSLQCEPKIQRMQGSQGSFWYAYDPVTEQTTYLESEKDVDRWLEEWFCRNL